MRLVDLARVARSKNAGPFLTTIDVFCKDADGFYAIRESGALSEESVRSLYRLDAKQEVEISYVEAVLGIKVTFEKRAGEASGQVACSDTFGAQQYIPILDMQIPGHDGGRNEP